MTLCGDGSRASVRAAILAAALAATTAGFVSAQEAAPQEPAPPAADSSTVTPSPSPIRAAAGAPVFSRRAGSGEGGDSRRTPQLSRFLLTRSRNLATLRLPGGEVMAHVGKLPIDGPDYAGLAALAPGAVLELPGAAACKLRSDVGLRFGDVLVAAANVAADFAGLYSFWLRAPESDSGGGEGAAGWRLVFNDEADVWGTQRDPERDRVEVPLAHELVANEAKELTVALLAAAGGGGGTLELRWGTHRWSAPFTASP